jgi:LCP family protein required for cell wall assembly
MPNPHEPARGTIIPFPAAAIRRPPAPAFVTQPVLKRVRVQRRITVAAFALASVVAVVIAVVALASGSRSARHGVARPARATGARLRGSVPGSVNLLIAGLDADDATRDERGARSDAVMLLHVDADREGAWLVSIPRDAWVNLPDHGENRMDAAYALGGAGLLLRSVERLTRLRIDHLAIIDRTGVRRLTDSVGGVGLILAPLGAGDIDPAHGAIELEMSGEMALEYVSGHGTLAHGDLEHIRREHRYVRALLAQLRERGTLADPPALRDLAASLGGSVRVDESLTPTALRALLDSTKRMQPEDVTFLTAPVSRGGMVGVAPIEDAGCAQLWDAIARDEMAAFVDAHPELLSLEVGR